MNRKTKYLIGIWLMLVVFPISFFSACKKHDKPNPPPVFPPKDTVLVLTSFSIESKNNPTLLTDIPFEIKGDSIFGRLSKYLHIAVPTFSSNAAKVLVNGIEQKSGINQIDLISNTTYTLQTAGGKQHDYFVKVSWNDSLPHITINTAGNAPIVSKDNYLNGTIDIDGKNIYANYNGTTKIRGRGNSTWSFPKKPYRLKLDNAADIFGLGLEKDWVLLANYLDETQLLNNIAFHLGKKLNVPFTNSGIPVELTLNGTYKGVYVLTQQVETGTNRVNVGDEGLLLEFDSYYDEDPKFKSTNFQLPIMVKDPDVENSAALDAIKAQFQNLENLVSSSSFPNNAYMDEIDTASLVNYLLVYMITDNEEINHPKSIYMHKAPTGKFAMGPVWDFDWAFGLEGSPKHFYHYNRFFWTSSPAKPGTKFFSKFLTDPKIVAQLKQRWSYFLSNNDLQGFVDEWSYRIEGARNRDYVLWKRGNANYQTDIAALKTWLTNRVNFLNGYINGL